MNIEIKSQHCKLIMVLFLNVRKKTTSFLITDDINKLKLTLVKLTPTTLLQTVFVPELLLAIFINLQKILVLSCYSTRNVLLFHHALAHYSLSVFSPCILRAVTVSLTCTRGAFLVHSCVLSAPLALIVTRSPWSVFTHSALCTWMRSAIIKRFFF